MTNKDQHRDQRESCCSGRPRAVPRPGDGISRRDFMAVTTAGAAGIVLGRRSLPVMAGPFEDNEYLKIIPTDKRLDPTWVASLTERGEPRVVTEPEALAHIGMPVGGICTGTLYLGGDGRLWLWDIFNHVVEGIVPRQVPYKGKSIGTRDGANYISPARPESPFDQGFALRIDGRARRLDHTGFETISFQGRYPIGQIRYKDKNCPVSVELEAYSPFIPLNTDDSSLPATVMSYTIKNESSRTVTAEISGWMENAVCLHHRDDASGLHRNQIVRHGHMSFLSCSAEPRREPEKAVRSDILFEDFEKTNYQDWTVTGTAFGSGPIEMAEMPDYQGQVMGKGRRVVNTHNTRAGEDVRAGDQHMGTLTSQPFSIERKYIHFLIGGGAHEGKTCLNLLIDGQAVKSATGRNDNRMGPASFNVTKWQGRKAQLQIVDQEGGGWGNIGLDHIVFSDRPATSFALPILYDFGTMGLTLLGNRPDDLASASMSQPGEFQQQAQDATKPLGETLIGALGRKLSLRPGQQETVTFVVTWHFPNLSVAGMNNVGRSYAARFADAHAVAEYMATEYNRLSTSTRLWCDTWYDSTLPYWFLDRTMANTTTLATSTCYRFKNGRFWAWEGIGCCEGTCTHVWHYAQAVGRLFPEIERHQREHVDFGVAFHADGGIGHRASLEQSSHPAHDGQCGRILGAYREHQMSADASFLKHNWPKVKKAIEYLIQQDANSDGMIEGAQPNTLDAAWFGKISFLASLYLATLRAGEKMALEMGDPEFAARCSKIAERGSRSILELYNGEYFRQIEDPSHLDAIGVGDGCYIDQVFGQSWAFQVGLGRLFDEAKTRSALQALWKYNFVPDVGPFREAFAPGRWYAAAGDAGLLMCTWPKGGLREDFKKHWQYMYFNECMTGFEWQVASHMIWEGMTTEGLAVARAISDRYDASLRNPYNEIECSDHYARAMASYGAFLAACGFQYHGPEGHLAFRPRLSQQDFKAAFTSACGWGSFSQRVTPGKQTERIELKYGTLRLRTLGFELANGLDPARVTVTHNGRNVACQHSVRNRALAITLDAPLFLAVEDVLQIEGIG